nr:Fic family protein [Bacillus methanolicus]
MHPFSDGNGRTAQLLMNLVFMKLWISFSYRKSRTSVLNKIL